MELTQKCGIRGLKGGKKRSVDGSGLAACCELKFLLL